MKLNKLLFFVLKNCTGDVVYFDVNYLISISLCDHNKIGYIYRACKNDEEVSY